MERRLNLLQSQHRRTAALKRLRPDVAAEVRTIEMYFLHGLVSGGLRAPQILAQRSHAEHATAIRKLSD